MSWFPYTLIGGTVVIVVIGSFVFMLSNKITDVRVWLALGLVDTFILSCVTTLALIIGTAGKTMFLSDSMTQWLGGTSLVEIAGLITIVVKFYFDKSEGDKYTVAPNKPTGPDPQPQQQANQ